MLRPTTERVASHTNDAIDHRLQQEAEGGIDYLAAHPGEIDAPLHEHDRE